MAMLNNQREICGNFESLKSLVNDLGDFFDEEKLGSGRYFNVQAG